METAFIPILRNGEVTYELIRRSDGTSLGTYIKKKGEFLDSDYLKETDVSEQFNNFLLSAAATVLDLADTDVSQAELIRQYELKLQAVFEMKAAKMPASSEEVMKRRFSRCVEWLRSTDFYRCPASTRYHESHPFGLLQHSLKVFNKTLELLRLPSFADVDISSAVLCSLTHDWCKIGNYEEYMRNVKNEQTGKWEQVPSYRLNMTSLTLGHGVTSMFLVSRFLNLTPEEAAAIRWHMGHWRVIPSEESELQRCNEIYPLVHLVQFADQLAITEYGNK